MHMVLLVNVYHEKIHYKDHPTNTTTSAQNTTNGGHISGVLLYCITHSTFR